MSETPLRICVFLIVKGTLWELPSNLKPMGTSIYSLWGLLSFPSRDMHPACQVSNADLSITTKPQPSSHPRKPENKSSSYKLRWFSLSDGFLSHVKCPPDTKQLFHKKSLRRIHYQSEEQILFTDAPNCNGPQRSTSSTCCTANKLHVNCDVQVGNLSTFVGTCAKNQLAK